MSLPNLYESTGSDHFQILLDRQMRSTGASLNVGQLILTIESDKLDQIISERIESPLFKWITQLQYNNGGIFKIPNWEVNSKINYKVYSKYMSSEDELDFYNLPIHSLDPYKGGLIKIDLYQNKDNIKVVFSWHHSLTDARGAEVLALYICGVIDDLNISDILPTIKQKPILELLNNARTAKNYLVEKRNWQVSTLVDRKKARDHKPIFIVIDFSTEESQAIEMNAKQHVRFGTSAYFMGGACMAFKELMKDKGRDLNTLMIPVPQDQRLKGSIKPILSNQVSYLFYRLQSSELANAGIVAKSISAQMMEQIKQRIPSHYVDMMQLFKRLPLFIYNHLSKGPTKGAFASFFFSDTGNSLDQQIHQSTSEPKITDAVHLPPASLYPGCTIVFMKINNKLKAIIATSDEAMNKDQRILFEQNLKSALVI